MSDKRRLRGEQIRREVMSDPFVDSALAKANDFDAPIQDLVMEMAWGSVWDRDDSVIPRKTRSLLTIAMLIALRATDELKGHVRGALRNGCSKAEIREVLVHSMAYCGCPAALAATRAAREIVDAWEE